MDLQTETFSPQLYQAAKTFFLQEGKSEILLRSPLSVCGHYLISQELKKRWVSNYLPEEGKFQCGERWFSTSHAGDKIFLALAKEKIAVDLEKIVERAPQLKDPAASRESFYMQWCAKECVVKFLNLPLDTTEKMLTKKLNQQMIITYEHKEYSVRVRSEKGYVYAILSSAKK